MVYIMTSTLRTKLFVSSAGIFELGAKSDAELKHNNAELYFNRPLLKSGAPLDNGAMAV